MPTIPSSFTFHGGIHPDYHKELAAGSPIRELPLPARLVVPLSQHLGASAKPVVQTGSTVIGGQLLAEADGLISAPVHAPAAGKVVALEPTLTATGRACDAIVIETASEQTWESLPPLPEWRTADPKSLIERIGVAGVVGMGGAGFPTRVKLSPPRDKPIDTVILNGAECEPYLTADHRMMLEHAADIRLGAEIICHILGAKTLRVAIEDNKPDAIEVLEKIFQDMDGDVAVTVLRTRYPQGSEKQQIFSVTGREVPRGGLPMDVGCVVENVSTAFAIAEAVARGRPLVRRVITVTGDAIAQPANLLVPCGALYSDLVAACGGITGKVSKVISGGPMMGFTVSNLAVPVGKTASGLLLLSPKNTTCFTSQACIACGRCVDACPMRLSPAELSQCIEAEDIEAAEPLAVMDCIECGSCAFVCPAHRPLVHHMRRAKAHIMARRAAAKTS
ncbi:MAG TPA: electron transport complex subunit RsxC [Kiritimatiellia bacterium]|nr:electron transport complex subunit RsxC [Kiritimatiellia bacterium]HOM59529.1 electron transport complex subunit RsxC [Kiritimatiellia bacterium]HOR97242.1 electron transport complex subunit RsxC [Kiritimatiellia bacterium]HPC48508.1 electron transport complex subunit RsxC [Kiritimatiellia bacterium]HPK37342.1 electron transport complex subunit RsxC [Kiritimatiellia bacterium]